MQILCMYTKQIAQGYFKEQVINKQAMGRYPRNRVTDVAHWTGDKKRGSHFGRPSQGQAGVTESEGTEEWRARTGDR